MTGMRVFTAIFKNKFVAYLIIDIHNTVFLQ